MLGRRAQDVDEPIMDYIIKVLADEDFDFGEEGEGAFDAVGELLVAAECVSDFEECRLVRNHRRPCHYTPSFLFLYSRFVFVFVKVSLGTKICAEMVSELLIEEHLYKRLDVV